MQYRSPVVQAGHASGQAVEQTVHGSRPASAASAASTEALPSSGAKGISVGELGPPSTSPLGSMSSLASAVPAGGPVPVAAKPQRHPAAAATMTARTVALLRVSIRRQGSLLPQVTYALGSPQSSMFLFEQVTLAAPPVGITLGSPHELEPLEPLLDPSAWSVASVTSPASEGPPYPELVYIEPPQEIVPGGS